MIASVRGFLAAGLTICVLSIIAVLVAPQGTANRQIGWMSLVMGLVLVCLSLGATWFAARFEARQEEEDWLG